MRLDRVWDDLRVAVGNIRRALDNNLTAQENFGPTGAPAGQVLTSVGPKRVPQWQAPAPTTVVASEGSAVVGGSSSGGGVIVVTGPPGPPGECPDCGDDLSFLNRIVCASGEVVVSGGNVVWS